MDYVQVTKSYTKVISHILFYPMILQIKQNQIIIASSKNEEDNNISKFFETKMNDNDYTLYTAKKIMTQKKNL